MGAERSSLGPVDLLRQAVGFYTPSGEERDLALFLRSELADRGFAAELDGAGNLIARLGSGERKLFLVGHLDTVEGEIPVRVDGEQLYGRGTVDAKGSLVTFIEAATAAKEDLGNLSVYVVGVVEEEASSRGARRLAEGDYDPDYLVIGEPSGWQGITLGYRGSLLLSYRLKREKSHRGKEVPLPAEEAVAFYDRVSDYMGSDSGFKAGDARLVAIDSNQGAFSDAVEMELDLRIPPAFDLEGLKEFVDGQAGEATVSLTRAVPAYKADKKNGLVRGFLRSIREEGGRPRFKVKTGTSDMNVLGPAWGVPAVAYGPGDSSLDHTPEERIGLEELRRSVEVLREVILELGNADG